MNPYSVNSNALNARLIALATVLLLLAGSLYAAVLTGLPPDYPKHFDNYGTVDAVDLNTRTVVIGDQILVVTENTTIIAPNRGEVAMAALQLGQLVGVEVSGYGSYSQAILQRAWIMPRHITLEQMHAAQQEE